MACHILLERSWWRLQLCFRPHLNWRFAHNVMGLQSCGIPNFGNDIWVLDSWLSTKYSIRGKVMASSSLGRAKSCESMFTDGSSMHQRCSNYALTNLLFGLCRSVWVIDLLANIPSPHLGALAHPSNLEVLWAKERTSMPFRSIVFIFGFIVEFIKELRGASICSYMV